MISILLNDIVKKLKDYGYNVFTTTQPLRVSECTHFVHEHGKEYAEAFENEVGYIININGGEHIYYLFYNVLDGEVSYAGFGSNSGYVPELFRVLVHVYSNAVSSIKVQLCKEYESEKVQSNENNHN